MAARRSVIHLSSLISSYPLFHAKKKQNYFRQGNHYGHFLEFGGLSRGPSYFGSELEAEITNSGW